MAETEPLLKNEDFLIKRTWRHFMLLPLLYSSFFGLGMYSFLRNEWTQYALTIAYLGNATAGESFSNCSVTANEANSSYHSYVRVQQDTARWQMYFTIAVNVTAAVANMFLPSYTDTIGRKFLLGASIFGSLIKYIISFVVIYFNLNFLYILIAHIAEGLTGSYFSLLSASFSYVADITRSGKERTLAITIVEGSLLIFITLSGLSIGILVHECGYVYPMLSICGLAVLSFLSVFILPETVVKRTEHSSPTVTQNLRRIIQFYTSPQFKDKRYAYISLILAFFFMNTSSGQRSTIETTYLLGMPFCWPSTYIGYFTAIRHAGQGIIGVAFVRVFQCCFPTEGIAIISAISNAASYVLEALATTDLMMFMVAVASIFSTLIFPLIRSMMSLLTPPDQQGAMFAGISTIEVVSSLVGTLVGNTIYAATLSFMAGFVFLILGGFNIFVVLLLLLYKVSKPKEEPAKILN